MTPSALEAAILAAVALGGSAQAATCGGVAPTDATEFRGPVLHVIDGERLCVALGPDPSAWVPVRLSDARVQVSTTPASRGALMAASFGQDVTCRITGRDETGVAAECATARGSVAERSRTPRMIKAGYAWR